MTTTKGQDDSENQNPIFSMDSAIETGMDKFKKLNLKEKANICHLIVENFTDSELCGIFALTWLSEMRQEDGPSWTWDYNQAYDEE